MVIFSAHGSPPNHYKQAKRRNLKVIDAVCPLVTKVHLEAKAYAQKGYTIIYVGHRGHPESLGVEGEVREVGGKFYLVENTKKVEKLHPKEKKVAVLTQTTLSLDDTSEVIDLLKSKFSQVLFPPAKDICYATENRQKAAEPLAKKANVVLVVGSKASSNSNRLREVAETSGSKAYLIDDVSQIKNEWFTGVKTVGLTSGASAPEYLVEEVIKFFENKGVRKVKEVDTTHEKIQFPLPEEIRRDL